MKSDQLFSLIKSLNKSEKRYFKLFLSLQNKLGDHYELLFNCIEQQVYYSEQEIKKVLSAHSFISRFPYEKNRLYNLILIALRRYHSGKSAAGEVRELLDFAEVLFNKKEYRPSLKMLLKARKIAQSHELFTYLIEIAELEQNVMFELVNINWFEEHLNTINTYVENIICNIRNFQGYNNLKMKFLLTYHKTGSVKSKKELSIYNAIFKAPLLTHERKALSDKAKVALLFLQASGFYVKGDDVGAFHRLARLKNYLGKDKNRLRQHHHLYEYVVGNMLEVCSSIQDEKKAILLFREFKDQVVGSNAVSAGKKIFLEARYYSKFIRFTRLSTLAEKRIDINSLLKESEMWFSQVQKHLNPVHLFPFLLEMSYIYFALQNYRQSLKWIQGIINKPVKGLWSHLQLYAKLMEVLMLYELKEFDLIPYRIRSLQKFLKQSDKDFLIEDKILLCIRDQLTDKISDNDRQQLYKNLKQEIINLKKNPKKDAIPAYFNFVVWLESKVENKPFADLLRKRAKQKNNLPPLG
ncbi:MAG: hypothetical protein HYU69_07415 [Bacteroidetes bacterium]|nr:hypothetical protein [Bacteroidota bacterium]